MTSPRHSVLQFVATALAAGASVWTATQWIAVSLEFHDDLGPPWITVFDWPIYPPWQMFPWWLAFGHLFPSTFDVAGLIAAGGGIAGGLLGLGGAAWRASRRKVVTTFGSARWASSADVRAAGLTGNRGVMLGRFGGDYLRDDGPHHVLAVAPTRSGKGVGLVVPTLLSWTGSAIIHDIKGENWRLTSGWRQQFSRCLKFNPTDPGSVRFNPLLEVRKGLNEVRDVQNIADILIDPDGGREIDSHWQKTANALLVAAILHVLHAEEDKSLARVATLLSDPARTMDETLWAMLTTNHLGSADAPRVHPTVAKHVRAVFNKVPNERSGVVSTTVSHLSLYSDPIVAAATATSDFQIADLVDPARLVSLYLTVPPSDLSRTRVLMRLVLNLIVRRLTEELEAAGPQSQRRPLLLMLDEFPALGRLAFFEGALAFLAGYGVRAYLIAQSLNQIEKAYGPNNSILDNCHVRIAFAANDERTAKRLSDTLGTKTELKQQRNLAGKRLSPWLANTSVSQQETARPLLTPGEILQLPQDEALVFVSGCPPIRAKKLRYYEDRNFTDRSLPAAATTPTTRSARPDATKTETWGARTREPDARLAQAAGVSAEAFAAVTKADATAGRTGPAREKFPGTFLLPGGASEDDLFLDAPAKPPDQRPNSDSPHELRT